MAGAAQRPAAVFFGTPGFAVHSLRALAAVADVVLAVSQPDRPAGRGRKIEPTPVKAAATEMGIPVIQPARMKDPALWERLRDCRADVFLVTAYGRMLPGEILDIPGRGCLNVHASLLPRHRGAAPMQWAILAGDEETGLTLMLMDRGLDTGPIVATKRVAIGPYDTAEDLARRLGEATPALIADAMPRWIAGAIREAPQPVEGVTLAPPLEKRDGILDFERPASEVARRVRAMTPWPGAIAWLDDIQVKILSVGKVEPPDACPCDEPGSLAQLGCRLLVRCPDGWLEIGRLQAAGRKPLDAAAFVCGRPECGGARLGRSPGGRRA